VLHAERYRIRRDDSHGRSCAGYTIYFARRGQSDRTEALEKALEAARNEFRNGEGIAGTAPIEIIPSSPRDVVGLQVVDYFLWAFQRSYERGEDRFVNLIWPQTELVLDVDDTRTAADGVNYTRSNPLTLTAARAKKQPADIGATGLHQ